MRRMCFLLVCAVLFWPAICALAADASPSVRFNRDIRPILSDNCFACHGPDPGTRKANLRVDRAEDLFTARKGGAPVVKGNPSASSLYRRITTEDEDDLMPPPASHKSLKRAQKETLRRWIEQGAPYEAHWSFIAPVRPAAPKVRDAAWVRNSIDAFVLAQLEQAGLSPAPKADQRTLIRRISLDLRGLPPSPQEVEQFINDKSPDAWEKLVDRMLASPHYGEHRARYWLDAARYADTHGLHFDNYREMWPYRDWVIDAFNRNLPFDQFTVQQLAGDLLPDRTPEQQIASGFNRCNITTNEGGTIPEENLVFYTRDRTETTARVWMGLTANCAVCHDHKFDPITMRDFYSMSAFFNNSTMGALDGNIKDTPPVLVVPRPQDKPRWQQLTTEVSALKGQIEQRRASARPEFDRWAASAAPDDIHHAVSQAGLKLLAPLDEGQGATTKMLVEGKERPAKLAADAAWQAGHVAPKAVRVGSGAAAEIPDAGDFDREQAFTSAVWARLPGNVTGAIVSRMKEQDAHRGWDLWVEGGRIGSHIIHQWPESAIKVVSVKPIDTGKWHHIAVAYDGSGKASGVKIYVDGEVQQTRVVADKLGGTTRTDAPLKIGQRAASSVIKGLIVQDLRVYARALRGPEIKQIAHSTRLAATLAKSAPQRSEAEKKELLDWWLATSDKPTGELTARMSKLEQEQAQIRGRGAVTLVMQEKPEPAKAFVLFRGEYDKRRDEVSPATPAALPAYPADAPRNRLGFAKWLLDARHPLTARVTVNRFWQEVFGTGIVKTTEDFGIMGESPSHPELLDWLAVEFRESGWDVKKLFKLIAMSSTYQQSAAVTAEKLEKDPANRLLSRGPRFRLDGEVVRDYALAASGLLAETIGGPSVRPYQPDGVWEAVAMPGSDTRIYKTDSGENLYRRSFYTFWKRAAPPASMEIFNAPSREVCTVRRERTNTPLQALVTMNDPQFVEAARVLAEKVLKCGCEVDGRLNAMAMRVLARPLRPEESKIVKAALEDLVKHYAGTPEEAKKLIETGQAPRDQSLDPAQHAAWTMVANQLLNLDEALNK